MTNAQKVKHAIAVLKELEDRVENTCLLEGDPIAGGTVTLNPGFAKNLRDLRTLLEKPHVADGVKTAAKEVSPAVKKLVSRLLDLIMKRKRNFRIPDMRKWAVDMDKIIRLDKRTPQELGEIIEWSQQDEFWMNNILSPGKLRKQLDRLELQMQRDHKWLRNRRITPTVEGKTAKDRYLESIK